MEIQNLGKIREDLIQLKMEFPDALADALERAMIQSIEAPAKKRCPIDTGHLKASIHTEITEKSLKRVTGKTGTNLFYGYFVEYGTGKYNTLGKGRNTPWRYYYKGHKGKKGIRITEGNKPQPFLTPAFDEGKAFIPDRIIKRLNLLIKKERRRQINEALGAGARPLAGVY